MVEGVDARRALWEAVLQEAVGILKEIDKIPPAERNAATRQLEAVTRQMLRDADAVAAGEYPVTGEPTT